MQRMEFLAESLHPLYNGVLPADVADILCCREKKGNAQGKCYGNVTNPQSDNYKIYVPPESTTTKQTDYSTGREGGI